MTATAVMMEAELSSPQVIANPYPVYHEWRDLSPVNHVLLPQGSVAGIDEAVRAWALLRYDDVYRVLRDHETYTSQHRLVGKIAPKLPLMQDDPPRHTRFRRLVNKAFTYKRVEALTPWIETVVEGLLDDMSGPEEEFIEAFAVPLPVKVIAHMLGIPGEDHVLFRNWSETFLAFSSLKPEERRRSNEEMMRYFAQMILSRRANAADDLITALVQSDVEGEALSDTEIIGFSMLALIAGNETTTNLIGNMMGILADRPDLWRQLRDDRTLVETVIDETLRIESPFQRLSRQTTRSVELSGVRIPEGDLVTVYYGAANRDPVAFPNPDEFRLDRELHNHVAFGAGIHYCLGAPLARAEANLALNKMLDRFPRLTRGGRPSIRQTTNFVVLGYQELPLCLGGA